MTNDQFRDLMITLLKQLAADVHDMNTLAAKRHLKAERQARYRKNLVSNAAYVDATKHVDATKEEESGKGNLPPTPPIREKGKGEEGEKEKNARAREDFPVDMLITPLPRNEGEVIDYFRTKGFKSDPLHFFGFFKARGWVDANNIPICDWHSMAIGWERNYLAKHPALAKAAETLAASAKIYSADDWVLCKERCANFNGLICTCGATIPPEKWTYPAPPEQCPKFKAKEATK